MAKLNFSAKELMEAIDGLVPDTTDRILLISEHGKTAEITAEYDDDESVYYVMSFCRLSIITFTSFDIWHNMVNSCLIMKERGKKIGELLLNPFRISEAIIKGEDVTEAFA